ncbi:uncharacterized protein BX663DRAFT_436131, partial [Cokeromyces recurvatus]|uniref:uncharacterized protein n=1 Tax=Cokeromyces recurvatus TaxID=90255 RepID=UPI0022206EB1
LLGSKPQKCFYHPNELCVGSHSICCLYMHRHLYLPILVADLISFLLNQMHVKLPRQLYHSFVWTI